MPGEGTADRPTSRPRPLVLCVLDGFGLNADPRRNALLAADMPRWRALLAEWPNAALEASGEAVGLPAGQMGNSEVGHLNLGAGFPVLQDLPRINAAIADGTFFDNSVLAGACRHAAERGSRLHLLGLIGPGGVHAVDEHLVAMAELAHRSGLPAGRVLLHAFTDGRDTPPRSADGYIAALDERLSGRATIATVTGRYFAMDRDRRWERTRRAWDAIVHGIGLRTSSPVAAVCDAYARGQSDEFIEPTIVAGGATVADGDAVVHLNFRADRARQLTRALALSEFTDFDRGRTPRDLSVSTLTEYQAPDELPVPVAFPPPTVDSLAHYLSRLAMRQLHIAETEKYAHVTYFFNGGLEEELTGEERVLIPSNRAVATYDLAPEMSAIPITDRLVAAIVERAHDFVIVNYANADMVGHTGVWEAAVRAAEVIDVCLGRVADATLAVGGALIVTADHGNIEEMRDDAGAPQTKHTTNPVPIVLIDPRHREARLHDGRLADVAPTVCGLLGIAPGTEMTGTNLVRSPDAPNGGW
ncbi:MAG TPA: 2,3-bisphosphoglycerate-independent phosphoglycerate mutase [Candidatus Limnocylindria bacterium]|nr:2,3-bisphosphoglycerate-independent phosphoglycerate mutase [Candidatus Limnocylindria bacterium]